MTLNSNIKFPRDYLVWDEKWANKMFQYGYERGMA